MADKTSIKSLAEEIVQVGAYESLKPDYVGLEEDDDYFFDGWNKLKTKVTYSDNFVDNEIIKKFSRVQISNLNTFGIVCLMIPWNLSVIGQTKYF